MRRSCVMLMLLSAAAVVSRADYCDDLYLLSNDSPSPSPVLTVDQINTLLTSHNNMRRSVVPYAAYMPMLKWDQKLADFAQEYISQCNGLEHSSPTARMNATRFGYWYVGENIAAGLDMSGANNNVFSPMSAVKLWNDEWIYYDFDADFCTDDMECRHYTQVVWAETMHIGCAMQDCPSLPFRYYWSCVYGVGGNFVTENPYEIATSAASSDECSASRGP